MSILLRCVNSSTMMRSMAVLVVPVLKWEVTESFLVPWSPPLRSGLKNRCQKSLLASERPRGDDDRYYDDGRKEFSDTRYSDDSQNARELRNLKYEEDLEESYYYDEEEQDLPNETSFYSRQDEEGEDLYSYEAEDDEYYAYAEPEDDSDVGNFWSNPKDGFDSLPSQRPSRRRASARSGDRSSPTPRRRTSFRSGAPSSPESITDIYERLFWYGFDTEDNMAVGDRTMFGGTKGKFNGLQLFGESTDRPPRRRGARPEPPQQFRADEWFNDMMGSIDEPTWYPAEDSERPVRSRPEARLPPSRPRRRRMDERVSEQPPVEEQRRPRRRQRREPESDWVSKEVSSWFSDEEDNSEEDELLSKREHRRPRRRNERRSRWSITSVLDNMFGVDRDEMAMNADAYNRQMGFGSSTSTRQSERGPKRRRPGYAYPYDVQDEDYDGSYSVADMKSVTEPDVVEAVDVETVADEQLEGSSRSSRLERAWEERAWAVERVPPSGVAAWGPQGEVGVDARTKATLDALEEIREATRKVEVRQERCIDAKEDLVVLKADVELQRKRLQASNGDPRRIRARLRQMQEEVDEASRELRRAKAEEELARDRLARLEEKHWALLSLYDADKAFQEVVDAFREFEDSERPAAEQSSPDNGHGPTLDDDGKSLA